LNKGNNKALLDRFYEHLDENDWLDGLDMYQSGHVGTIHNRDGLIMAEIRNYSPSQPKAEVRIKIHPSAQCIQWIECTCRKNRTTNQYCEHITAAMIHIDREKPKLFASLDEKMPLKPPTINKRRVYSKNNKLKKQQKTTATQSILKHMEGAIHSVSLLAGGPQIRVRIEIKPGHLTNYNLDLDDSARFLIQHEQLRSQWPEFKNFIVGNVEFMAGLQINEASPEKIEVVKVFGLNLEKKSKAIKSDVLSSPEKYRFYEGDIDLSNTVSSQFLSLKNNNRYIGTDYIYIPDTGYFSRRSLPKLAEWAEIPSTMSYEGDKAAVFFRDRFQELLKLCPLWMEDELEIPEILEKPNLSQVNVVQSSQGWFSLDPTYKVGKSTISMAEILASLKHERRKYIRTGKSWLRIPDYVSDMDWQLDESGKNLKVDALGLMRIRAAMGEYDAFVGGKKALNELRQATDFTAALDVPSLSHTNLQLRPYQEQGLQWLWWLHKNRLHGLLADEMGLGKTHQAMAYLAALLTQKPNPRFLVICPTTVLDHWLDKLERFAPKLNGVRYHGTKRRESILRSSTGYTLVTSYGVVLRDIIELTNFEWDAVILDEAHFVKNNDTATYRAVCSLRAASRVCLSGTPMENHLGELKAIFDFLLPGYLGSDEFFRRNFLTPITNSKTPEAEIALQKLLHPFKLRRTKNVVLKDLPDKVEDIRHCVLSDEQSALYKQIVDLKVAPLVTTLRDEKTPIPYLHVFAAITLLKQICDHPALIDKGKSVAKSHSGKFELLKELITEAVESDQKVVIYSQYLEMLNIISNYLEEKKIGFEKLTGQSRNRGRIIERFQTDPSCKVFCASLLAGGIGIDLTAASVVIHYDRWWNPTKEDQATDRVHRIGQHRNVQVLKLVTRGTLEEKIDKLIASKREIFEKFLDQDEKTFRSLSRSEILELLET
jgi:superfamily II DNA or RNA helicase